MPIDPIHTSIDGQSRFHKKVYTKLTTSPLSGSIPSDSISSLQSEAAPKKIIPSSATKGPREAILPLLIEVLELRQMIDLHRTEGTSPFSLGKASKSPKEILSRFQELQEELEELQRWSAGVILQISKGIEEARRALENLNDKRSNSSTLPGKKGLLETLKRWLAKTN